MYCAPGLLCNFSIAACVEIFHAFARVWRRGSAYCQFCFVYGATVGRRFEQEMLRSVRAGYWLPVKGLQLCAALCVAGGVLLPIESVVQDVQFEVPDVVCLTEEVCYFLY